MSVPQTCPKLRPDYQLSLYNTMPDEEEVVAPEATPEETVEEETPAEEAEATLDTEPAE